MKKMAVVVACVLVLALVAMASPEKSMKGWISDEMCGAKGANAAHKDCAMKCAQNGEKLVFVDDGSGKVMKIANQDAVKAHAGEHVQITASAAEGGSLNVSGVKALAEDKAKSGGEHVHQH